MKSPTLFLLLCAITIQGTNDCVASSLLDRALEKPFVQEKWVQELYDRIGAGEAVEVTKGRSPQGQQMDLANPRIDIHAKSGREDLFLAVNKKTGETEAIDWNPDTLEYDFVKISDIRNHPSHRIQIEKDAAVKQSCTPCHQHEGPIFPTTPWVGVGPLRGVSLKKHVPPIFDFGSVSYVAKSASTVSDPSQASLSGRVFRFKDAVSSAWKQIQNFKVCQDFWATPTISRTLKTKFVKHLAYQFYVRQKADRERINLGKYLVNPLQYGKPVARVLGFLTKYEEANLWQFTPTESQDFLRGMNDLISNKNGFALPAPFFLDRTIASLANPVKGALDVKKKFEPNVILSKQHAVKYQLMHGEGPLDPAQIKLSQDPRALALSEPITVRPPVTSISPVDLSSGKLAIDFEDRLARCLWYPLFSSPEEVWEEIRKVDANEFNTFLSSDSFDIELNEKGFPRFSLRNAWNKYTSRESLATCKNSDAQGCVTPVQLKPVQVKPVQSKNEALSILKSRCTNCHQPDGSAKKIPLFDHNQEVIPAMAKKIEAVILTGQMGRFRVAVPPESEQKALLKALRSSNR